MASPEYSPAREKTKNPLQEWFETHSIHFPQNWPSWKPLHWPLKIIGELNPLWKDPRILIEFILRTRQVTEEQLTSAVNHPDVNVVINTFNRHRLSNNQMVTVLMRLPDLEEELRRKQQSLYKMEDEKWGYKWLHVLHIRDTIKEETSLAA